MLRPDRPPRPAFRLALIATGLLLGLGAYARPQVQTAPREGSPIEFRVFRMDRPVTGLWEFSDPIEGITRRLDLRASGADGRSLTGVLLPEGREILTLEPKSEGLGYSGEIRGLLAACGQDRVTLSDFVPLGDEVIAKVETTPPLTACPFLEGPPTARLFVGPTAEPIRLRAVGEIASEKGREQIGLGGQRTEPATPIVADATLVEGGTEVRFRGRVRSLDGSLWIEVEGLVSPAPGIEPPRGYLSADKIRVAATLTLTRVREQGEGAPR